MTDRPAATILPTHTASLFAAAVQQAVTRLRANDVVALPTETVYGLAANALSESAVEKIFRIKGRPAHNPIIVHVASLEMARTCAAHWPEAAARLAAALWPGPLTIVVPRAPIIPDRVTAGGPTVGVRWPFHPLIQAVIRECGFPLAAPSANLANALSPTTADHVHKHLGEAISLIVDGGPSNVGIESTVVDVTVAPPRILRPGIIHDTSLASVLGSIQSSSIPSEPSTVSVAAELRSPGLLQKHYSPKARLRVWSWRDEDDLLRQWRARVPISHGRVHVLAHARIPALGEPFDVSVVPHDPEAFARALYGELHRCDDAGAEWIIVEALPDSPAWRGVADRLRRASS